MARPTETSAAATAMVKHHDLPGRIAVIGRSRGKHKIRRIKHNLNAHKHDDHIPAYHYTSPIYHEQSSAQHDIMRQWNGRKNLWCGLFPLFNNYFSFLPSNTTPAMAMKKVRNQSPSAINILCTMLIQDFQQDRYYNLHLLPEAKLFYWVQPLSEA